MHIHDEYWHIISDSSYCSSSNTSKPSNPSKIYSDYNPGNLVRTVISKNHELVHKSHHLNSKSKEDSYLDPEISLFFHKTDWHMYQAIGSMFLCEGQRYNHIPGNTNLVFKDIISLNLQKYLKSLPSDSSPAFFLPETFDLSSRPSCLEFLAELDRSSDDSEISWILKKSRNSHNGEGIDLLTRENHEKLLNDLDYGNNCGISMKETIIQRYIKDPLLLFGRKFDFRVFMIIANMNPLVLMYYEGFLRVTLKNYDKTSEDLSTHVTNTQVAKAATHNLTNEEKSKIMEEQMWTYSELEDYLVKINKAPKGWVKDTLVPDMKQKMMHLARTVYHDLLPHPGVFELFGIDFLLDDSLHLWFLEANKSPAIMATTERKGKLLENLIEGLVEIELALLNKEDFRPISSLYNFEIIYDGFVQINSNL
jgi:hypothetical protein